MAMDAEMAWRNALNARGRDWVAAELQRRPGQPEDTVLDVVFEEPYPSREFCMRWCNEQDNRMFRFSGHTIVVMATSIVLVSVFVLAVASLNAPRPHAQQTLAESPQQVAAPTAPTNQAEDSSPFEPTTQATPAPSECAYMTYETAACKTSKY